MRELIEPLREWYAAGEPFVVATVAAVDGSAPHGPGACLAVGPGGAVIGGISGGCVEGQLYELAHEALRTGETTVERFTSDPDDPFEVALICGGSLDVIIQPIVPGRDKAFGVALSVIAAGRPAVVARTVAGAAGSVGGTVVITGDTSTGSLGRPEWDAAVRDDLGRTGVPGIRRVAHRDGAVFLVEEFTAPPRLLLYGAVEFARPLSQVGALLGYRVTVCDAREVFAVPERFPHAHEVVADQPLRHLLRTPVDGRTVVVSLTHDPKFDIPLLAEALRLPVAFVGAIGSRTTCADRLTRLREAGVPAAGTKRLRAPVGLDLGGRQSAETAVSIMAEVIAAGHGGSGLPLTEGMGAIHPR